MFGIPPALLLSLVALCMFVLMLVFSDIGRRIGVARRERDPNGVDKGIASVEAAVFALLGLLIAFTFSGAASRFEERRHLITIEANAIGTAWLRLDLLPRDAQADLRALFRTYLDSRVATYAHMADTAATRAELDRSAALQGEIWTRSLAALRQPDVPSHASVLMVPALNDMFDITTTRLMSTRNHPPLIIFLLLGGLSLVGAMLVGFDTSASRARPWLPTIVFAGIMSLAANVILELEFPRYGLIRVDSADQVLVDLRSSMR
jgi:hypothetical protein